MSQIWIESAIRPNLAPVISMIVRTEQYRACELRVIHDERGFQVDVVDPNHTFLGSSHLHKDARSAMVEAMTLIDQRFNHLRTARHSAMLRVSVG